MLLTNIKAKINRNTREILILSNRMTLQIVNITIRKLWLKQNNQVTIRKLFAKESIGFITMTAFVDTFNPVYMYYFGKNIQYIPKIMLFTGNLSQYQPH